MYGGRNGDDGGVSIDVKKLPRGGRKADEEQPGQSKLEQLFERLGGSGSIKVNRILESGKPAYCGVVPLDDDLLQHLEERIGEQFGAGNYSISGWQGVKYIASAPIAIDEAAYPRKKSETELKREEAAKNGPPQQNISELFLLQQQQQEKAEIQRLAAVRETRDMYAQQLAMMQQAQQQQTALTLGMMQTMVSVFAAKGDAAPQQAGLPSMLEQMSHIFKMVDTIRPPQDSIAGPNTSMTERLAGMVINPIATKVGEAVAGQLSQQFTPQPAPRVAAPVPPGVQKPTAPVEAVSPGGADSSAPSLPPRVVKPIPSYRPGVKPLTKEQLLAERNRRSANGKPSNVQMPAVTSAPSAEDIK